MAPAAAALTAVLLVASTSALQLDTVDFGSAASLASHNARSQNATAVVGALGARGLEFTPYLQPGGVGGRALQ